MESVATTATEGVVKSLNASVRPVHVHARQQQRRWQRATARVHGLAAQLTTPGTAAADAATPRSTSTAQLLPSCGGHGPEACHEAALQQATRALRVDTAADLQDVLASMVLSECVYKKVETPRLNLAHQVTAVAAQLPAGWLQLEAVQVSLPDLEQHYIIANSSSAMYVAFMGTKQPRDLVTDANLLHEPVWAEAAALAADKQAIPAAHRGFLARARSIHVEQLYELAVANGKRLVLCGHSLGGAVAKLCTLRLLRELPDWPSPRVRCITFATPAVGNAALAEMVESAGWASYFASYYLPEDQLVRLLSFSQVRSAGTRRAAAAAAEASCGAAPSEAEQQATATSTTTLPGGVTAATTVSVTVVAGPHNTTATIATATAAAAPQQAATAGGAPPAEPAAHAAGAPGAAGAPATAVMARATSFAIDDLSSTTATAATQGDAAAAAGAACMAGVGLGAPRGSSSSLRCTESSGSLGALFNRCSSYGSSSTSSNSCSNAFASEALQRAFSINSTFEEERASQALEEILAPGLDALEAAAAATAPPIAGGDLAAAQREALLGGSVGSRGIRLALDKRRIMRRVRQLAAKARLPLPRPPVSTFHAFGAQWFVSADGAFSPEELAARPPGLRSGLKPQVASAEASAGRGFFSFHRMMAYRQRYADILRRTMAGGSSSVVTEGEPAIQLSDSLFPRVALAAALARPPLGQHPAAGSALSGGGAARGGGGGPFSGMLPLASRSSEGPTVFLTVEVDGENLQYCRSVVAKLVLQPQLQAGGGREAGPGSLAQGPGALQQQVAAAEVALPTEVLRVVYGQPYSFQPNPPPLHPLSLLQNMAHHMAGSVGRYLRHPAAGSASAPATAVNSGRVPPGAGAGQVANANAAATSRMLVRVEIPKAAADALLAGAGPAPQLSLHVRSDFHRHSLPIVLRAQRTGIIGTSAYAAALTQAALTATTLPAPAGAGAAAAGTVPWWWPQPVEWIKGIRNGAAAVSAAAAAAALDDGARVKATAAVSSSGAAGAEAVSTAATASKPGQRARKTYWFVPGAAAGLPGWAAVANGVPQRTLIAVAASLWQLPGSILRRRRILAGADGAGMRLSAFARRPVIMTGTINPVMEGAAGQPGQRAVGARWGSWRGWRLPLVRRLQRRVPVPAEAVAMAVAAATPSTVTGLSDTQVAELERLFSQDAATPAAPQAAAEVQGLFGGVGVGPVASFAGGLEGAAAGAGAAGGVAVGDTQGVAMHQPRPGLVLRFNHMGAQARAAAGAAALRPTWTGPRRGWGLRWLAPSTFFRAAAAAAAADDDDDASATELVQITAAGPHAYQGQGDPAAVGEAEAEAQAAVAVRPRRWFLRRISSSSGVRAPQPSTAAKGGWFHGRRGAVPIAHSAPIDDDGDTGGETAPLVNAAWPGSHHEPAAPAPALAVHTDRPDAAVAANACTSLAPLQQQQQSCGVATWFGGQRLTQAAAANGAAAPSLQLPLPVMRPLQRLHRLRQHLSALANGRRILVGLPRMSRAAGVEYHNLMVVDVARPSLQATTGRAVAPTAAAPPFPCSLPHNAANSATTASGARGGHGAVSLAANSPYLAVRRLTSELRQQSLQLGWWRRLLEGVGGALLRPVALVGRLLSAARFPGLGRRHSSPQQQQVPPGAKQQQPPLPEPAPSHGRSHAEHGPGPGPGWQGLVVVASCADPLRLLRSRDMRALRGQAAAAGCALLPVLLTSPAVQPAHQALVLRTLAAGCGVDEGQVRVLVVPDSLLLPEELQVPLAHAAATLAQNPGASQLQAAVQQMLQERQQERLATAAALPAAVSTAGTGAVGPTYSAVGGGASNSIDSPAVLGTQPAASRAGGGLPINTDPDAEVFLSAVKPVSKL